MFCGILVISVIALLFCSHWQLPVVLPLVAASVLFIPGYYIILTLQGMARIISMGQSVPYGGSRGLNYFHRSAGLLYRSIHCHGYLATPPYLR